MMTGTTSRGCYACLFVVGRAGLFLFEYSEPDSALTSEFAARAWHHITRQASHAGITGQELLEAGFYPEVATARKRC